MIENRLLGELQEEELAVQIVRFGGPHHPIPRKIADVCVSPRCRAQGSKVTRRVPLDVRGKVSIDIENVMDLRMGASTREIKTWGSVCLCW